MKQFFLNQKMWRKLLLSPVCVMSFLLIFGITAYMGLSSQRSAITSMYSDSFVGYEASAQVAQDLTGVHANIYKMLSWAGANFDAKKIDESGKQQVETMQRVLAEVQKKAQSAGLSEAEKRLYGECIASLTEYKKSAEAVIDIASADVNSATMFVAAAEDKFQILNKRIQELVDRSRKQTRESYDSSTRSSKRTLTLFVLILCAALVVSWIVAILTTRTILSPINKTVEVIKIIAGGNLTKRIEVDSNDEIGEMARHFNVFADKLHKAIAHVAESSNEVSLEAGALDRATELMASGMDEAAVQVTAVATASEEMSKTSSEIAQNCAAAVRSSHEANTSVSAGETIIGETIRVMNRISDRVKESAEVMKSLGERSDQIGQVVGLINDVADQTNLLALNAAIEAARAGEHGRGFAVVADEVRKLAERTSHATKEISETIRAMQTETKKAVSSMEEGVSEVGIGTSEASRSGEALNDILLHIGKVTTEINQIAVASEEETATTDEIASSIQQISQAMQETARRIQENAGGSSKLAGLSKELRELVGQFTI